MRKTVLVFYFTIFILSTLTAQIDKTEHRGTLRLDSIRTAIKEHFRVITPSYNADSVRAELDRAPYFSLYKDNYFIGGTTLSDKMTAANSSVKFQLSISQKLTRSRLPFNTFLYIQFTQKTIWNVLEKSLPMYDLNFNPGVGLGRLMIYKNRHVGNIYLMLEHESNGKDSISSRSWNKVSFGGFYYLTTQSNIQLKAWIPIVDGGFNRDIVKYNGLAQIAYSFHTDDRRFNASVIGTWRPKSFSFNTQWELSYKINLNENQYLFLQYYNGYGEHLLDYNKHKSMLRVGFVIKPQGISIF